jgi:hypothetical protein
MRSSHELRAPRGRGRRRSDLDRRVEAPERAVGGALARGELEEAGRLDGSMRQ